MKLFLDSSNPKEIERWLPVISGVTTNPAILLKEKGSVESLKDLVKDLESVSIEVTGSDSEMLDSAYKYAEDFPNVSIKVPLLKPVKGNNINIIRQLVKDGVSVNCTALFNLPQVMIAANAISKADYKMPETEWRESNRSIISALNDVRDPYTGLQCFVSLFYGRVYDEGFDANAVLLDCVALLHGESSFYQGPGSYIDLICGSVRTPRDIVDCYRNGADVVTVPPAVLERYIEHSYSRITVQQFEEAAAQSRVK